ncbi:hypothetical protein GC176_20455 [bacterium]|nr:hypothetical protein [bacterium]
MAISYQKELNRAHALREEAERIEKEAHANRPLPKYWKRGQKVRYLRSIEWGPDRGSIGFVHGLRDSVQKPAAEYQVFYTGPSLRASPSYWTTPDDVELVV